MIRTPLYLFNQQATIKEYLGTSGYGVDMYKATYAQKCIVRFKRRMKFSTEGEDAVNEAVFLFPYKQTEIPNNSIIIYQGKEFRVKECKPIQTFTVLAHWEVTTGY